MVVVESEMGITDCRILRMACLIPDAATLQSTDGQTDIKLRTCRVCM